MEHNIEKNIRLKVQEAEQYPVRWGKKELWARMEINRSASSRRPVYFSVAASLAIVVLAAIYTYQHITAIPDNPMTAKETESVQSAVVNEEPTHSDIPANIEQDVANKVNDKTNARIRTEERPYISTLPVTSDTINILPAATGNEPLTTIHETANADVATEDAISRPKVIIGIIPQQEQPLLTQREKRKKLRFLKGKSTDESEGNQLIIARIN